MRIKRHIPNILSTIRLVMAIGLPFVFTSMPLLITLIYYVVGASTDFIDGALARRWKVQSRYGKIVDPIADKSINGIMLILTALFINPLVWLLTGMEAAIAGVTALRSRKNKNMNVSQVGRVKTVALGFATALTALSGVLVSSDVVKTLADALIGVTFGLQTITAFNYIDLYLGERKNSKKQIIEPKTEDVINDNEKDNNELELLKKKKPNELEATKRLQDKIITYERPMLYDWPQSQEIKDEDGISRTYKK